MKHSATKFCTCNLTVAIISSLLLIFPLSKVMTAQQAAPAVLSATQLPRVVPTSFYFDGQAAPTQMRNAAAARFGPKRYVIAALVDTSGYSAEVRARYEGFLITDSQIRIGGAELRPGAYGFGFTEAGKLNIFDVGGNQVLSVNAADDKAMHRPRPLMMQQAGEGVRLYSGRRYVVISAK
jgi:hypothetical protein